MADAAGYVVQSNRNHFLSRKGRYVRHSNRSSTKGVERGWVHSEAFLLNGGDWAVRAVLVHPARYNPARDLTEITGEPLTWEAFLEKYQSSR